MIYGTYEDLLRDCKLYETHILKNKSALRRWYETHKNEDIHFCNPANAIYSRDSHDGFDFDEMRGY